MCGIFAYHNQNEEDLTYKSAISAAWANRHRGHSDGFGIIDLDRKNVFKQVYSLEEVKLKKLAKFRGEIPLQVGIVKYVGFDEKTWTEKNDKFQELAGKLQDLKSSNLILHHRAASFGDVKLKNTHPIPAGQKEKKTALYVHNGSVPGAINLGKWLELEKGWKFQGDTDTEVIGNLIEHLHTKHKGDGAKVWDDLHSLFPGGFGVVIRVNEYNTVEIWKDNARPLYFYVKEGEVIYVSEPIAEISGYNCFYSMEEGYLNLNLNDAIYGEMFTEDVRFLDMSVNLEVVRDYWEKAIKGGCKVEKAKCDDCNNEKANVMRLPYSNVKGRSKATDICFECWVCDGGTTLQV